MSRELTINYHQEKAVFQTNIDRWEPGSYTLRVITKIKGLFKGTLKLGQNPDDLNIWYAHAYDDENARKPISLAEIEIPVNANSYHNEPTIIDTRTVPEYRDRGLSTVLRSVLVGGLFQQITQEKYVAGTIPVGNWASLKAHLMIQNPWTNQAFQTAIETQPDQYNKEQTMWHVTTDTTAVSPLAMQQKFFNSFYSYQSTNKGI